MVWLTNIYWARHANALEKEGTVGIAAVEYKFWFGASCFFKITVNFSYSGIIAGQSAVQINQNETI